MRISVALATWNGAAYLESQLRSIASQTRPPDQVVLSDDASTDGTIELAQRVWANTKPVLEILQVPTRTGVVANFERAISATNGDIVVLSDQDDVWNSNKLAVIARSFERRPGLGGVFSDGWIVDAQGRRSGTTLWQAFGFGRREQRRAARSGITEVLLQKNVVTGATLAFAGRLRELVLPIGRSGLHDAWIAMLVAAAAGLEPLPYQLIEYRIHPTNVEGLGVRGVSAAIRQRARGSQWRELAQFEAMLQRLRTQAPGGGITLAHFEEKANHLRRRCGLPEGGGARALNIIAALPSYARYSSTWRSPLLDLIAPTAASATAGTEDTAEGASDDSHVQ